MKNNEKFKKIPSEACVMRVSDFVVGDNGKGAKSAPISLLARSLQPIEHWWWGKVVHDIDGVRLHKDRMPIDYVHDSKEVIGYFNKHEKKEDGLHLSGALVPFKDNDRASEIIYKMKEGVPYEASINFGGEGMKIQDVENGEVTEVNGYMFEGPGIVIREWPLRGVAVCPYGADMNTKSETNFSQKELKAEIIEMKQDETKKELEQAVEDEAKEAVESEAVQEDETKPIEPVESEADEATEEGDEEEELNEEAETELSQLKKFQEFADKHGYEFAKENFGKNENEIELLAKLSALENEVKQLKQANNKFDTSIKFSESKKPKTSFREKIDPNGKYK